MKEQQQMRIPRFSGLLHNAHGAYYLFAGAWPLVHMDSFEAVTGPKPDEFLVRTVGLILLMTGTILLSQRRAPWERSAVFAAMGTALILGCVAVVSASGGWVWKVFFAEGAMHLLFATAWIVQLTRDQVPFRAR